MWICAHAHTCACLGLVGLNLAFSVTKVDSIVYDATDSERIPNALHSLALRVRARRNMSHHEQFQWSIVFVGDSQMRYQWLALCNISGSRATEGSVVSPTTSTCHIPGLNLTLYLDQLCGGVVMQTSGERGEFPFSPIENKVNATLRRLHALGLTQPDVVYINAASTHLMHMHGGGRDLALWPNADRATDRRRRHRRHVYVDYYGIINLEEWIVGDLLEYDKAGALAVHFLGPMRVRHDMFHGRWRAWVQANLGAYIGIPMEKCIPWMRKFDSKQRNTLSLRRFCVEYSFTAPGSQSLSARMLRIVRNMHSARTYYMDAYALTATHPNFTTDGVHYHPLFATMLHHMLVATEPW